MGDASVNPTFRGAASSKARTSWTAKAETMDFVSFTGLLVCYLFSLESMQANKSPTLSPHPIRILLGGYSYGAMITTLLPPISSILPYFTSPQPGSPAAEIRFRAAHLARTHLHTLSTSRGRSPGKLQPPSSPIVFGGHEPGSFSPTPSSRRSLDSSRIRQSIERSRQKLHLSTEKAEYQHTSSETPGSATATEEQLQTLDIQTPKTAYLLISPILGAVAGLATLFSASSARSSGEEKLLSNDTMVVYGDEDAFTSVHKLRRWCEELKGRSEKAGEATFRYCEVGGAGHFWREIDVEKKMRETVRQWIRNAVIK